MTTITMKPRRHLSSLQVFLHLPAATTSKGSRLGAALVAVLAACAITLVADAVSAGATPAARAHAAAPPCRGANLSPTPADVAVVDAATLCLVNRVRASDDLRPLRFNRELGHVAASQVTHMVHADYFADVRPSGQTPLSLVAVTRYPVHAADFSVGQNIAWGTGSDTTPAHIVQEWMASPPHRKIMLATEFRDAGVAVTPAVPTVLRAGADGATYAIEFGVRRF
jgi:uncharacterized protein YkwD